MKNSQIGYYLKLTLTLLVIAAVVSGLLGLTNFITEEKIANIAAEKTAASMQEVLPADEYTPVDYTGPEANVASVHKAGDAGFVVEVTPAGFGGAIDMVVGVASDGTVTGVSIVKMTETSGLGANAASSAEVGVSFRAQFVGQGAGIALTKSGGSIDALSGATITSTSVTHAVAVSIEAVGMLLG